MNIRDVLGCPSTGMGTGVTLVAGGSIGQARLRITGPAAGGVGAGIQLTESSDKKSEILTTGGAAAQGPGKPNLAACSAHSGGQRHFSINLPVGFAVLVLSTLAGEQIKIWLHLPISGNVLGLFVLLLCFRLRLIPPRLIEEAANRLLFVLPALFIPIFVLAIYRGQVWSKISWGLFPTLLAATAGLWIFVGHLAQHLLRQSFHNE